MSNLITNRYDLSADENSEMYNWAGQLSYSSTGKVNGPFKSGVHCTHRDLPECSAALRRVDEKSCKIAVI
jgi:hypothetical protein